MSKKKKKKKPRGSTWADVERGARVAMPNGLDYVVTKIKAKGKRAKVTLIGGGGTFAAEVRLKDVVSIKKPADKGAGKKGALHDDEGRMQRWASEKENRRAIPAGDPKVAEPPRPPSADPWETRRDKVERRLDELLNARLIGEATDENAGYYVPPVDLATVASHMAIFHAVDTSEHGVDDLLTMHGHHHEEALTGARALDVNHWHTQTRPEAAK